MTHRLAALALILILTSVAPAGVVDLTADWQGHAIGATGATWPVGGQPMHVADPTAASENPNAIVGSSMVCEAFINPNGWYYGYAYVGAFGFNVNIAPVYDSGYPVSLNLVNNFALEHYPTDGEVFADASVSLTGYLHVGSSADSPAGTPLALRVTPAQTGDFFWGLTVTTAAGDFLFAPGSAPADLAVQAGDTVAISYFGFTNPDYAADPTNPIVYTEGPYTDNLTANFEVVAAPEPTTLSLLGLGLAALLARRRKRS